MSLYKNHVTETKDGTLFVELTQGQFAIVDDTPAMREVLMQHRFFCAYQGSTKKVPYATTSETLSPHKQRQKKLHHFVVPKVAGKNVDHINGNTLDDRAANLRLVSFRVNALNVRVSRRNKTGVTGLHRRWDGWAISWQCEPYRVASRYFNDKRYGSADASKQAAMEELDRIRGGIPEYAEARSMTGMDYS
jgi:hypothetical protein